MTDEERKQVITETLDPLHVYVRRARTALKNGDVPEAERLLEGLEGAIEGLRKRAK